MNRALYTIIVIMAVVIAVMGYFLLCPIDHPVARFGQNTISTQELNNKLQQLYGRDVLQSMITDRLVSEAIEANKIVVSKSELDLWISDYTKRPDVQEILLARQLDEASLRENLATSVPLYYLALQGVPEADRQHYFAAHRATFEELELMHILLGSETEALELLPRLTSKDSFSALAAVHSLDERTNEIGGNLGRVTRQELTASFGADQADILFGLKPGDVSIPMSSLSGGWHLFFVKSKTTDYDGLRRRVVEEMAQQRLGQCLETLRDQAKVEIYLPVDAKQPLGKSKATSKTTPTTSSSPMAGQESGVINK